MIALMGGLGAVVYQIVAPVAPGEAGRPVADMSRSIQVIPNTLPDAPAPVVVAGQGFSGRLELRTASLTQADAFIKAAIEDNGLKGFAEVQTLADRRVYRIECRREGLDRLVADLGTIWKNFDSATLVVDTGPLRRPSGHQAGDRASGRADRQPGQRRDQRDKCTRGRGLNTASQAMPGRRSLGI